MSEHPTVYVTVSGGVADYVTEGAVNVVLVDWDAFEEGGLNDYTLNDLEQVKAKLTALPEVGEVEQWRYRALESIDDVIERKRDLIAEEEHCAAMRICRHCGVKIEQDEDGDWEHAAEAPIGTECWTGARGPAPSEAESRTAITQN